MADHVTPNLPSRDFDVTEAFYAKLGFATSWKDRGWMILQRGGLQLEFFPYPDLDPATSIAWLLHGQKLDAWGFVGMGLIIAAF
ncbi:hypothetical protein ACK4RQ_19805, partial [Proteus mirabilis]